MWCGRTQVQLLAHPQVSGRLQRQKQSHGRAILRARNSRAAGYSSAAKLSYSHLEGGTGGFAQAQAGCGWRMSRSAVHTALLHLKPAAGTCIVCTNESPLLPWGNQQVARCQHAALPQGTAQQVERRKASHGPISGLWVTSAEGQLPDAVALAHAAPLLDVSQDVPAKHSMNPSGLRETRQDPRLWLWRDREGTPRARWMRRRCCRSGAASRARAPAAQQPSKWGENFVPSADGPRCYSWPVIPHTTCHAGT